MEERIIDKIVLKSKNLVKWAAKFKKQRYLYNELLKISKEYFIGIKGIRGVGKTVLMLQLARKWKDSVYFLADSPLVKNFSLYEIVQALIKRGYKNIFIDEIHRKAEWDRDIKGIYDEHEARVIFSGSSAIDLAKTSADLSRRVVLKELKISSFREFLNIKKGFSIPKIEFQRLIKNKKELAKKYLDAYEFFEEYLTYGGVLYPKMGFFDAMENALRKTISQDMEYLREINIKYEEDAYKLLYLIARSLPFETNYSRIAKALEVSKTMAIRLVSDLCKAGIIIRIMPCRKKGVDIKKEPKLYLNIPLRNFFKKIGLEINRGALREEFFVNHLKDVCYIKGERGEKTPDFRFGEYIIEVGGRAKSRYQNADFIAVEGLNTEKNKIPLFLFGFVY